LGGGVIGSSTANGPVGASIERLAAIFSSAHLRDADEIPR
jgi:hypothetical protein